MWGITQRCSSALGRETRICGQSSIPKSSQEPRIWTFAHSTLPPISSPPHGLLSPVARLADQDGDVSGPAARATARISKLSCSSLAVFARTTRTCHIIASPILYTRHGRRAVAWASKHGRLDLIQTVLSYAEGNDARTKTLLDWPYCVKEELTKEDYSDPDGWWQGTYETVTYGWMRTYWKSDFATPLHVASLNGHDDIVTFLLDRGASIEAPAKGLCNCLPVCESLDVLDDHILQGFGGGEEPAEDIDGLDVTNLAWIPLHFAVCK